MGGLKSSDLAGMLLVGLIFASAASSRHTHTHTHTATGSQSAPSSAVTSLTASLTASQRSHSGNGIYGGNVEGLELRATGRTVAAEIAARATSTQQYLAVAAAFDGPFPGYPLPDDHLCGSGATQKQSVICKACRERGGLANGTEASVEKLCGEDVHCVGFTRAAGVFYPLANITTVRTDYRGWQFWQKHGYRPAPAPSPSPNPTPAPPPKCAGDLPPPPPPGSGPLLPIPPPGPPWMPPPKPAGTGPKTVFAHYMMCFHAFGQNHTTCSTCQEGPACQYSNAGHVDGYVQEISHAARYGLDGFALEWLGSEPTYRESFDRIFAACEHWNADKPAWATSNFSLIPIIDNGDWAGMASQVALHINSSCMYRVDGRPFISSWGFSGLRWNNETQVKQHIENYSKVFVPAIKATGFAPDGPFYLPSMYPPNYNAPADLIDQQLILQLFPELDGLWTWGCGDTGDVVANASIATVQACSAAKKYAAGPISAPYSPHRSAPLVNGTRAWSNVRYFNSNGAKAMITTWEAHIASQPDFVIYTTWNDLAEHHYLGPYNHTYWGVHCTGQDPQNASLPCKDGGDQVVWHTAFPHTAYLELSHYYVKWYKQPAGSSAPPVTPDEEGVFYFYNLQPVHNTCPGDYYGRPQCGDYYPCNATARSYRNSPGDTSTHCEATALRCANCTWCDDGMASTADFPVEDMLYVTLLLASAGTLLVESGLPFTKDCSGLDCSGWSIDPAAQPSKTSFDVPAGVSSVKVPLLQGGQRFTFTRGSLNVTATGSEGVNTTELSKDICNHQTFSGVLHLKQPTAEPDLGAEP